MSIVTIVLSTYNRPEALRVAIRSVTLQTVTNWRLLVIGDCCDERTAVIVNSFADTRITYINLPTRCGEQAFPNSIGMALAETEYISLLNHDDVLLQDHLEIALRMLQGKHADMFIGLAAFSRYSIPLSDGSRLPIFSEINLVTRKLSDVFALGYELFEPCSTWMFHRDVVDKVGLFRSSAELYRTPMEDWLLRAWRAGVTLGQMNAITVLRMLTHYQQVEGTDAYSWEYDEHKKIEQLLMGKTPDQIRAWISNELNSEIVAKIPKTGFKNMMVKAGSNDEWLANRLLTPEMAEVFLRTGWDAFDQFCILIRRRKGLFLSIIFGRRTGQEPPPTPDFGSLLDFARTRLNSRKGSQ